MVVLSLPALVVMSGVRIGSAAGFVLDGDLQLLGTRQCDHVTWKERPVIGNYHLPGVAILDMHATTLEALCRSA